MAGPRYDEAKARRAVRFIESYLRHTKGVFAGQPFVLEPWQRDEIIMPIFGTVDEDGRRWYREAAIWLPRKNGKSELGSAIALYGLLADGEHGSEVYSVAGSKAQASLVFNVAKDMVRANPLLRAMTKVYRSVIEVPETGSIYRTLSADADLQHGLNPHVAIIDEYHVHRNSEQYEAMLTGTGARRQPLQVTISTPGPDRRGHAWELFLRGAAATDDRMFHYWRGAPDTADLDDRDAWRQANPASWITEDFLEAQRKRLAPTPQVFERLHLGRFPSGHTSSSWIPRESWDSCSGEPQIDPDRPVVIAVDAASRKDTTAVIMAQRDDEGVVHARLWSFQADPEIGWLDYSEVEDLIRDLASTFEVRRVAFDPFQMVRSQQMLINEGIPAETFPQNDTRMVPASALLYDLITEKRLRHGGDPVLTEQTFNAATRETARGWRLEKRRSSGPIDAVIALAMACQLAEWEAASSDLFVMVV